MSAGYLSKRMGITESQARRLTTLINQAEAAQVKEHNEPGAPSSLPAVNAVEAYAKRFGFETDWPGLFPIFQKDGETIHLDG